MFLRAAWLLRQLIPDHVEEIALSMMVDPDVGSFSSVLLVKPDQVVDGQAVRTLGDVNRVGLDKLRCEYR